MTAFRITILIIVLALFPLMGYAAMSSTNYKITSDSFNSGGAIDAASDNYKMDVTVGEQGAGWLTSDNYIIGAGFEFMQYESVLSLTISDTTMNLGTLTANAVGTDSHTLTVTTTNGTGYTMTIQANHKLRTAGGADIDDVAEDTQVTAGSEAYGIALVGGSDSTEEGDFNDDDTPVPTSAANILSSSAPVTDEVSTVTYRAAIDSNTAAGDYGQTVTYSITANA